MPRYSRIEPEWLDTAAAMTLGGDSRTTFHRRRTTDPNFPQAIYRGRRPFWPAAAIRAFYEGLAEREPDAGPSDVLREARRRAGLASVEARRRKREIDASPSASTPKVI